MYVGRVMLYYLNAILEMMRWEFRVPHCETKSNEDGTSEYNTRIYHYPYRGKLKSRQRQES